MSHLLLILGMIAVTYIPRLLPMVWLRGNELPPWLARFLSVLPACALGALLIPSALTSVPGRPEIGIAVIVVAGAAGLLRAGMLFGVIAGVAVAYVMFVVL